MNQKRRIRVRGRQRADIDLDLLAQALIMIAEEQASRQEAKQAAEPSEASPGTSQ